MEIFPLKARTKFLARAEFWKKAPEKACCFGQISRFYEKFFKK